MRLIIAGGRDFNDYDLVEYTVPRLYMKGDEQLDSIISGLARGADQLGIQYATKHGIPVERFPADWDKYGKSAGYRRNEQMADHGTHLLAFWDGKSRGTMHMINIARRKGLPVKVVEY